MIQPRQHCEGHYSKVKGHTLPGCCTPQPPNQCPYQVSTFYTLQTPRYSLYRILKQGQGSHHNVAHLHSPTKYQHSIPYGFRDRIPRFSPDKILNVKVKSRSHHDVAHQHPQINVPTKYQVPKLYGFRDMAQTRF